MFVFIDTSIYVRVIEGRYDCTMKQMEVLSKMVGKGELVLIVPEVVSMELVKYLRHLSINTEIAMEKIKAGITNDKAKNWNALHGLSEDVTKFFTDWEERYCVDCKMRGERVRTIIDSPTVRTIRFTQDIWFKAKRRLIDGGMPRCEGSNDQDAAIIESLREVGRNGKELLICSANTQDFGLLVKDKYTLHPFIRESLPESSLYTSLQDMLDVATGKTKPPQPSAEEERAALVDNDKWDRLHSLMVQIDRERFSDEPLYRQSDRERNRRTLLGSIARTLIDLTGAGLLDDPFVDELLDDADLMTTRSPKQLARIEAHLRSLLHTARRKELEHEDGTT